MEFIKKISPEKQGTGLIKGHTAKTMPKSMPVLLAQMSEFAPPALLTV